MSKNDDLLDGTVDEVKEKIDNAVDLDYKSLLQSEEEGKDRKTVKEYIEQKIGEEVDEEMHSESDEVTEDDVLEEIEEETAGGILGSYSRNSVFAGGLLLGLLVGLVAMGLSGAGGSGQISPAAAQDKVTQIVGPSVNVSEFQTQHGLYEFNITTTGQRNGTTVSQTQSFYMTMDGAQIIPKQSPLTGQSMIIDVSQAIKAAQQQNQQPDNQTSGNTTQ
ncbi:hypothetical protein GKQ38_01830 [Candidatus Nanohaloarchaea archaeon]|nr:hypothetical protein GKQ38_01830 [Candidatus Nanohaloarchaea archaeon]